MVDGLRDARAVVPYDTLSPEALQENFVQLDAAAFAKLWHRCDETGLEVVADVHTHRFAPTQSRSDRSNPMVALPGHVAIILPNFARGVTSARDIGLHQYLGSHRWVSWFKKDAADRVEICRGQ
jgi:proteasome lid subunit RPN8/RPN11